MERPVTTLFMLESLDGKISTGAGDNLLFIILGSIFLGTVCGVVSHKRSLRTSK